MKMAPIMQLIDKHFCNNKNDDGDDNNIITINIIIITFNFYSHSIVMIGVIVRAFCSLQDWVHFI